ncbi:serine/threonine protein kinase [Agromyces endophyticus]|uniref:serine/threonine-protein kinase n=1 Tax=Agromyces sp. H17E-10 TaxID=2932244 RepID=UPI001FD14803|nr:serine/threonine-protein kinase [Agromyces sp. H17E-10]UOQ88812.1 serine/threonine protein kinase [Agromyces sp. H17E-10]
MRRAPSTPPDLPGYSSLGLLGSGGFADVFLYEQKLPRRKVAVKVLLTEELGRDTRAQFVAEANLMAQLSAHPFIVTIFHADVSADGRPYFVMEYCSGPSLAERYKREPFSVEDALRTGVRLAGAIATAHAAGILHRDIKPANVLTNDYGWPALTDFGISSNLEGELPVHTVTAAELGATGSGSGQSAVGLSVPWSPAEMFEDDPKPDTRSDVFSLAATVHTLLAGRTPFEIPGRSNGSLDLMGRIERGAITPIGRPDVPASLVAVLAKGMAVHRADRYPSAVEFARALQRVELELGYAATTIEVPNLGAERDAAPADDGADATRARTVQTVEAQAPRPAPTAIGAPPAAAPVAASAPAPGAPPIDDDRTRARTPQQVVAQPQRPAPVVDDATVIRGAATPTAGAPATDATIVRPRTNVAEAPGAAATETRAPRRGRVGAIIAAAAGVVIVAVVGIAIALAGTFATPEPEPTPDGDGQDALIENTVPVAKVEYAGAKGSSAVFEVSHDRAEDGDRYRWARADGSGTTAVTEESTITVDNPGGGVVCIDVQVQRGSKTSEQVRGCSE